MMEEVVLSAKRINVSNTKHSVVSQVATTKLHWTLSDSSEMWDVWWMDSAAHCCGRDQLKKLKPHQKINHLQATTELCVKNQLARNLNRMKYLFPQQYDFHPFSFILPKDKDKLAKFVNDNPNATLIVKPASSAEGRGIRLVQNVSAANLTQLGDSGKSSVVQEYISNPFLIDGLKFDLRLYVLITCVEPLNVHLYHEGLVRICTRKYESPSESNINDNNMHLTNYTVNKVSPDYNTIKNNDSTTTEQPLAQEDKGNKRTFQWFIKHIAELKGEHASNALIQSIKELVCKAVISAQPTMASLNKSLLPPDCYKTVGFELLGFDVLLDSNLKPYVSRFNPPFANVVLGGLWK